MRLIKAIRNWFLRRVIYRKYSIGKGFYASGGVRLWAKSRLQIGTNFYMGRFSEIQCDAVIGDNVLFGNSVCLAGRYDHNYQQVGTPIAHAERILSADYNWKGLGQQVVIGDDVWIGIGSIVLTGVVIGEGSIIGAGSVVTRNVEPYSIYAGVPARKLGERFETDDEKNRHIELMKNASHRQRFMQPIRY